MSTMRVRAIPHQTLILRAAAQQSLSQSQSQSVRRQNIKVMVKKKRDDFFLFSLHPTHKARLSGQDSMIRGALSLTSRRSGVSAAASALPTAGYCSPSSRPMTCSTPSHTPGLRRFTAVVTRQCAARARTGQRRQLRRAHGCHTCRTAGAGRATPQAFWRAARL